MVFTLNFNGRSTSCEVHFYILPKLDEKFLKYGKNNGMKIICRITPVWKNGLFIGFKILLNSPKTTMDELSNLEGDVVFFYSGMRNPKVRMNMPKCWLRHFKEDNPFDPEVLSISCELENDGLMLYVPKERQIKQFDDCFLS